MPVFVLPARLWASAVQLHCAMAGMNLPTDLVNLLVGADGLEPAATLHHQGGEVRAMFLPSVALIGVESSNQPWAAPNVMDS